MAFGHGLVSEMKEHELRLYGKIVATICVTALTVLGYTPGQTAAWVIGGIWIITIPEFVEAFYNVRAERERQLSEDAADD